MRKTPLATGEIYHIFNRGIDKQNIFFEKSDYYHFCNAAARRKDKSSKFSSILSDPVSDGWRKRYGKREYSKRN